MTWLRRNPLDTLCTTLDAERDALLRGDHDALAPLLERKERQLAALVRDGAAAPEAIRSRITPRLDRNRDLLAAAAEGLRAARDRLRSDGARADLCTYGADGARNAAPSTGTKLERRA